IEGLEQLTGQKQVMVFQAGTKLESGPNSKLVTGGGRVLGITAWDSNIEAAIKKVYQAVDCVRFEGMQFRRDIGQKAIKT
ncbi:MAG: phosphoribosylglycinamide synthetase C domain-containing protein, partial [Candidatus Ratteibacteria bacterium]|nr:phosphoribosylglycinamide synthetase C domain-containing protein [Candidatus Ratteibacteria bacterium]